MSEDPRAVVPVTTGHFEWAVHRLAYEVGGDNGVPCLLMHGLLLDSMMNRDLARRFVGEGYRVVLLDFLGHGGSGKLIKARSIFELRARPHRLWPEIRNYLQRVRDATTVAPAERRNTPSRRRH